MKGSQPSPECARLKKEGDHKYEAGNYEDAVALYTKAIECHDRAAPSLTPSSLYGNRAVANFMLGRFQDSISDALEGFQRAPNNYKMLHRAACAAWTMGDLRQGFSLLERIPVMHRSDAMKADYERCREGITQYEKIESHRDTPISDAAYRKIISLFPECPSFYLQAAKSLVHRKQYLSAAKLLESVKVDARSPAYSKLLGQCFYFSGCEHFRTAMEALNSSPAAMKDSACLELLKHIQLVSDLKAKADNAFRNKQYPVAYKLYTDAIEKVSGNKLVLRILFCNRAAASKEMSNFRDSIEDCTRAVENDPQFAKAFIRRGRCYMAMNNLTAAVADYTMAVKYDSLNDTYQNELQDAKRLLLKHEQQEARKHQGGSGLGGGAARSQTDGAGAGVEGAGIAGADYYAQLGLERSATEKEIKTRFRELSLKWHPDKCVNLEPAEKTIAEMKFKNINEAYSVLSDATQRRDYDLKLQRRARRRGGLGGEVFAEEDDDFFAGRQRFRDPNQPRTFTKAGKTGWW